VIGAATLAAIAFTQTPGIALARPGTPPRRVTRLGLAPAFSPDGRRLAVVVRGDLWTLDADGTHGKQLTRTPGPESAPTWSPDGRLLAFARAGAVWTIRADGRGEQRLVPDAAAPSWSPDGRRVAFERDGDLWLKRTSPGAPRRLTDGAFAHDPAFSPDGRRVAYASDELGDFEIHTLDVATGARSRVTYDPGADRRPTWSPDGRRLAWERDGAIWTANADGTGARRLATGTDPSWQPAQRVRELLPDLSQRPPAHLRIGGGPGRWQLGFDTAVDNVGDGPFVIVGRRPPGAAHMDASQRVLLANGGRRTIPDVGRLHYETHPPHHHWHFQPYERYTLHRPDGTFLGRDHKQGFCLADHYGVAPGTLPNRAPRPVYLSNCDWGNPRATFLVEGSSVGFTDLYPGFFHGQTLDLTGLPAGIYLVVNRSNPDLRFRELRYDNDVASTRFRLSWRGGVPRVTPLRSCRTELCG